MSHLKKKSAPTEYNDNKNTFVSAMKKKLQLGWIWKKNRQVNFEEEATRTRNKWCKQHLETSGHRGYVTWRVYADWLAVRWPKCPVNGAFLTQLISLLPADIRAGRAQQTSH